MYDTSARLPEGTEIFCKDVQPPAIVKRYIGHSGMGKRYLVNQEGREIILTWYHAHALDESPSEWYHVMLRRVRGSAPLPDSFWMPTDITEWRDGAFGVVLPPLPEDYCPMTDYLLG